MEILLNSQHFLKVFSMRPLPTLSLAHFFLSIWKVLRWDISHVSFIYVWLVIPCKTLLLGNILKWKSIVNLMPCFSSFFDSSLTHPLTYTLIFSTWKLLGRYISGPSFIYVWFVVRKFSNVKCFLSSRNLII